MTKQKFLHIIRMDSVGLMVLILLIAAFVILLTTQLGVPSSTIDKAFLPAWLVINTIVYFVVLSHPKIEGKFDGWKNKIILFICGAYIGWAVFVWPKIVGKETA